MVGQTLSHYTILEQIGAGGMGVVYRARDLRLERDVAIKVLPAGALGNEAARKQFRKEALHVSKLNHPNIETVHDFDSDRGVDFLVMELIPGRTLSERIAEGPLPMREIARLGEQLADGLFAAHTEEILHCDIKPGNLRVTPAGRLKILDFGLARLFRPVEGHTLSTVSATGAGAIAGTLPYMAPEQLRGEPLDPRTDIYAAGAVLYEMASAERAFPQEPAARAITAILSERPTSLREVAAGAGAELDRIVSKCLEKEPPDRYQSAADLAVDLRHLGAARTAIGPLPNTTKRRRNGLRLRAVIGGAAALVALLSLSVALDLGGLRDRIFGGGSKGNPSLAVLPLANLSGDRTQDYFADGMTDELITRLAQVSALRVISRSSIMQYKETKKSLPQIARELGVQMVLEGSVLRAGDAVRITAKLIEAATGRAIWAEGYERSMENVLALQSEVAQAIVSRVEVKVTPTERGRLESAQRVNPAAHEEYLRGIAEYHKFESEGFHHAIDHLQRSLEMDPGYAPAYIALANVYTFVSGMFIPASEAMSRARAAAQKALELDPGSGAAKAILGYVRFTYDWDWNAEPEFKEAVRLSPGDATVHQNYAVTLVCLGRTDEAIAEIRKARDIDPLSPLLASMSLWPLFEGHRFREAAEAARNVLNAGSDPQNARMVLGEALFFTGQHEAGIAQIRQASDSDPENPFPLAWLGFVYGASGRKDDARTVLARFERMKQSHYVQPYCLAIVHIGLGERNEAFRLLNQAVDERSDELLFVRVDPALDSLRSDPRFGALLQRMRVAA